MFLSRMNSLISTGLWHGGNDAESKVRSPKSGVRSPGSGRGESCIIRRIRVPSLLVGEGQGEGVSGDNTTVVIVGTACQCFLCPRRFYLRPAVPFRQSANPT